MSKKVAAGAVLLLVMFPTVFFGGCSMQPFLQRLFPVQHGDLILHYSRANNLDPHLVAAVIFVESRFRGDAVSPRGASGLMQLMPDTAVWAGPHIQRTIALDDLFEPETNIAVGTWYLQYLRSHFATTASWLAAYNAGQGNVRRWLESERWDGTLDNLDSIPFRETRVYVRRVLYIWEFYQNVYPDLW